MNPTTERPDRELLAKAAAQAGLDPDRVMEQLDRIPKAGDSFTYGGLCFTVLSVSSRRVDEVEIKRVAPPDEEED